MSPPKELYTVKSLFTLGGASFSVVVLSGALNTAFGWRPAWLGLVFAEILAFAGLSFLPKDDRRRRLQLIIVAFCNGLLIYTQATGFNTLNQGVARTRDTKTATLVPVIDPVPWWPPADQKRAADELIKTTQNVVASIDESIAQHNTPENALPGNLDRELSTWRQQLVEAGNKLAKSYGAEPVAHPGPALSVTPDPIAVPSEPASNKLFETYNLNRPVMTRPMTPTEFRIDRDYNISTIVNVHSFGARPSGGISLRSHDGTIFGPWSVSIKDSGPGYAYLFSCNPDITIPPGTYTIIDPDPDSWWQNAESQNRGFTIVFGSPSRKKISSSARSQTAGEAPTLTR